MPSLSRSNLPALTSHLFHPSSFSSHSSAFGSFPATPLVTGDNLPLEPSLIESCHSPFGPQRLVSQCPQPFNVLLVSSVRHLTRPLSSLITSSRRRPRPPAVGRLRSGGERYGEAEQRETEPDREVNGTAPSYPPLPSRLLPAGGAGPLRGVNEGNE